MRTWIMRNSSRSRRTLATGTSSCQGPPVGTPSDWDVSSAEDGSPVGHVRLLGAGTPGATTYRFRKAGALFAGGKQMDLWNAVQSLLE